LQKIFKKKLKYWKRNWREKYETYYSDCVSAKPDSGTIRWTTEKVVEGFREGYAEDVIAHRGVIEAGLNFIGKPYAPQQLAKKLREILRN
jgi:hypothetical protein